MGTEESNKFGTTYKFPEPKDETLNRPLQPNWTTSMQAYYNSGSTPSPLLNPHAAGPYFSHFIWPNQQANSTVLQYEFLHDPRRLSNNSAVPAVILNQQQQSSVVPVAGDAASVFPEKLRRMFGGNNLDSIKKCDGNLQPKSPITKEPRENENGCSTPNHDKNGVSLSGASGKKESPDEGHDIENDFPSNKKHQFNVMVGSANSTEQIKNSETGLNTSGSTAQLAKLEEDEIRKERKRQSNRESAKRSRLRKQKECEELHRNMDILKDENSSLTQRLISLSEECLELSNENDSMQEELVKMYGPQAIADLLPMKPA